MTDVRRRTTAYAVLVVAAGIAGLPALIAVLSCQAVAGWTAGRSAVPVTSPPQPMEQPS